MINFSNKCRVLVLFTLISLTSIGTSQIFYNWSINDEYTVKSGNLDYSILQITDNDYSEYNPKIHGDLVTWGIDPGPNIPIPGDDSEIFFYNSFTGITTQITDNEITDRAPQIHDGLITWLIYDGNDYEILLYDSSISTSLQITNDANFDYDPKINNGLVLWVKEYSYYKTDLFLYNYFTGVTTQITDTPTDIWDYNIHEGLITWATIDEIFLYDYETGETIQITNNNYYDGAPEIHDGLVTWIGDDDSEIFLYDYETGETIQITNNNYYDGAPEIYDGLITWGRYDGNDIEIILYDHETGETIQITDNEITDRAPQIHNRQICWDTPLGEDGEIFLYDYNTRSITQITDNIYHDESPQIYNGQITWRGRRPNVDSPYFDYEIFLATIVGDTTPPVITIEYYDGDRTDGNSGKWNVFAYDDDSGINEDTITIMLDGEFVGNIFGDYDVPNSLGEHSIYVEVENNEGFLGSDSKSVSIIDDDILSPELSNLIIIPRIFEINVTFNAFDESGIEDISTFINGELVEPIHQIQYENTYSLIFENQWLFQSGTSKVEIHVEDSDDDRPSDALTSSLTGTFENVLYPTYACIIWQIEELKNYIDENLSHCITRSLNKKLSKAQDHLYEALDYFEDGRITCALFYDYLAKQLIRFAEVKTENYNRRGLIEDYHSEYMIDSLHEIRNNIILLMGVSTGEKQAHEIALIEVELLNLKDFIEEEILCCVGRCLSAKISCSAKLLEIALFKISMEYNIDCLLGYSQCKLEQAITRIEFLVERGKIPVEVANYLVDKISSIIEDIELINQY